MWKHIHTFWILLCLLCKPVSSLWLQTHVYCHWDDIVSVLQWVPYIAYLIIFSTCMYLVPFAYILSLSFYGHVLITLIVVCYILCFAFLLWYLLKNLAAIIHMKCIKIHDLSLWYTLEMHIIVQISWPFMC